MMQRLPGIFAVPVVCWADCPPLLADEVRRLEHIQTTISAAVASRHIVTTLDFPQFSQLSSPIQGELGSG